MKKKLLVALKIAISFGLISWLLSRADLNQIWQTIRGANIPLLVFAFAMFYVGYFITGMRWKSLMAAVGVSTRLLTLVQSYCIAMFFNNFLPSTVGGDASRIYDSYRMGAGKARSVAVIFLDRVFGLSAILILCVLIWLLVPQITERMPRLPWFIAAAVIANGLLGWVVFGNGGKVLLEKTRGNNPLLRIANRILEKLYSAVDLFQGRADVMLKAVGLSLLLQVNVVIHCIIVAKALHIEIPTLDMFIIIPLSYLLMAAPISINGIGLRESVFVYFFGLYGVSSEQALAFSFTAFAMILAQGVVGGIVFMLRRGQSARQDLDSA